MWLAHRRHLSRLALALRLHATLLNTFVYFAASPLSDCMYERECVAHFPRRPQLISRDYQPNSRKVAETASGPTLGVYIRIKNPKIPWESRTFVCDDTKHAKILYATTNHISRVSLNRTRVQRAPLSLAPLGTTYIYQISLISTTISTKNHSYFMHKVAERKVNAKRHEWVRPKKSMHTYRNTKPKPKQTQKILMCDTKGRMKNASASTLFSRDEKRFSVANNYVLIRKVGYDVWWCSEKMCLL